MKIAIPATVLIDDDFPPCVMAAVEVLESKGLEVHPGNNFICVVVPGRNKIGWKKEEPK